MSGDTIQTKVDRVRVTDFTVAQRAAATAYISRTQPDPELLLDILGLGRPKMPALRNIDGSAQAVKRHCGCGRRILAPANARCSYCLRGKGQRRTPGAIEGDL